MTPMSKIKSLNRGYGFHFFEKGTMGFFNSRVLPKVYGGRFFLTGERFDENTPEMFSVRMANPDGSITTVGGFQQYATVELAKEAAESLAALSERKGQ